MWQLNHVIFILYDSLSSQRCPCVKQFVGNYGSDCGLSWIGYCSTIVLDQGSLADPDCLSHLRHHGQDTCRQLLVAQIWQAEVLFLGTCKMYYEKITSDQWNNTCNTILTAIYWRLIKDVFNSPNPTSSTEPGSKKVTLRPSPGFFTGGWIWQTH